MNQEKIKLALICESDLLKLGINTLCQQHPCEIVGEADSCTTGLELIKMTMPELAIIELKDPNYLIERVKQTYPHVLLLVRGEHHPLADDYFNEHNGATLLKKLLSLGQLALAERQQNQPKFLKIHGIPAYFHLAKLNPLSPRELEVLSLISYGYDNRAIAAKLSLSVGTVKYHVNNILGKLEASDRTQAVVIGLRGGIIC
jgi:two-component system NarL family response regulator